jgi:hypothetical protein
MAFLYGLKLKLEKKFEIMNVHQKRRTQLVHNYYVKQSRQSNKGFGKLIVINCLIIFFFF